MIAGRALLSRSAPLLACLGLLAIWQVAALALKTDSFPTALEAIRAVPSILGDKSGPTDQGQGFLDVDGEQVMFASVAIMQGVAYTKEEI